MGRVTEYADLLLAGGVNLPRTQGREIVRRVDDAGGLGKRKGANSPIYENEGSEDGKAVSHR